MSPETARHLLNQAFLQLSTPRDAEEALLHFDRLLPRGLDHAYTANLTPLFRAAVRADYQQLLFGPEFRRGLGPDQDFKDYNNTLPTDSVIQLLFPDATPQWQQALAHHVQLGHFDHNDLLFGWASLPPDQQTAPELEGFIKYLLEHPHVRAAGLLPLPDLQLPGVAIEVQEWLIGIYVAAFSRAPDYAGLHYWAQAYAQLSATGLGHPEIMRLLSRDLSWSAEQNQEHGTQLNEVEFVHYYYQQVLGREPDSLGGEYWLQALSTGALPRSEFIAVFLNSALLSPGDGGTVKARIAVAAVATALDQQAPGQVDLAAALHTVFNPASALAAIEQLHASIVLPEPVQAAAEATIASHQPHPELADAILSYPSDFHKAGQGHAHDVGGYDGLGPDSNKLGDHDIYGYELNDENMEADDIYGSPTFPYNEADSDTLNMQAAPAPLASPSCLDPGF